MPFKNEASFIGNHRRYSEGTQFVATACRWLLYRGAYSISYPEVQTGMSASSSHSVVSATRAAKPPVKLGGGRGIFAERRTQNTERCMTLKFRDYG